MVVKIVKSDKFKINTTENYMFGQIPFKSHLLD